MSKIMLVEDDNNLREIYEARLLAEGYQIISAKDGEEALALATKEKPDLIISDVMMPKISGFDMLDILRSTPGIENTKVVMMTALSQAEDKERADKLGANKYLVKSQVTLEDVARVADELLNGTSEQNETQGTQTIVAPEESAQTDQQTTIEPTTAVAENTDDTATQNDQTQQAPADNAQVDQKPSPTEPMQPTTASTQAPTQDNSTQQAPPPPPAPVMPEVNTDSSTTQNDQTQQAPADNIQPNQKAGGATQATQNDDNTAQQMSNTNTATQSQQLNSQSPSNNQSTNAVQGSSLSDNTQTTAEEGRAVDTKIDDFVKNQLQSNEPSQPESEAEKTPEPKQPEAALDQGSGVTLANKASATPTLEVKQAPQQDNNQSQSTEPSANTNPAPNPAQQQPEPAPIKQVDPNSTAPSAAGGQRVIQPLPSAPDKKSDINQLADEEDEEHKQQSPLPASSVVSPNGQTTTPPSPDQSPNSTGPGNIIQPGGQTQNTPAPNDDDPSNIAL